MPIIDISGPIEDGMWHYDAPYFAPRIEQIPPPDWLEYPVYSQTVHFAVQAGTYLETAAHMDLNAMTIDELPLERCYMIDALHLWIPTGADQAITPAALNAACQAAGVQPPTTWDELITACDTLNAAGIIPIAIGTKAPWTAAAWFDFLNMGINGPEFHRNLMLLTESYTDERVTAVFDHWRQLYEHNCFLADSAAYEWQDALDFMNRGEAAMYLMGDFIRDSVPDEIEDDLDFVRFPIINPDMPIGIDAPTDGYFMSPNAPNMEGGMDFLAFLGSQEAQQFSADELGRLPTRTDVDTSNFTDAQRKGIELVQTSDFVLQFYDRDTTPEMAEAGLNAFAEFIADPMNADVAAILESLEADRERIAAEQAAEE